MASGFDAIFDTLESMNRELNVVTARLNALESGKSAGGDPAAGGEDGRAPGAPIVWMDVPVRERGPLWEEFVDWVLWVADVYELTPDQLPRACWWRHGSAVEELTALWTAHQSAYGSAEDVGSATYLWQDALARGVERLNRVWLGACTNGFHDPKSRESFRGDTSYRNGILEIPGGDQPSPPKAST